jgi:hypothetical protein
VRAHTMVERTDKGGSSAADGCLRDSHECEFRIDIVSRPSSRSRSPAIANDETPDRGLAGIAGEQPNKAMHSRRRA